jgi:hypothetical protein
MYGLVLFCHERLHPQGSYLFSLLEPRYHSRSSTSETLLPSRGDDVGGGLSISTYTLPGRTISYSTRLSRGLLASPTPTLLYRLLRCSLSTVSTFLSSTTSLTLPPTRLLDLDLDITAAAAPPPLLLGPRSSRSLSSSLPPPLLLSKLSSILHIRLSNSVEAHISRSILRTCTLCTVSANLITSSLDCHQMKR